ncbi:asparagine--tRNA ligase [Lactobacillus johnsonii]|jgi:asparaginyl-tRNA synthetase|uniref:Asparagine--tRNA ligase n=4 Tax=Lactobacillus TaxID=1578 RepID=SYN_LACJO|nr:asparagine--tRNA ligase [Lactobacillus johnsonii]Q74JA9.1 RecName: Full=Asparagine--tRNA ligase; AltName: Full=Asparaginyl-tRNA synthetase; Short=AsnRS [Lactobacillus johnsonii NCC 533]AAS09021.1 asparaginyl-tRNA synthetase [Lactobacillus johnsonii NCC 533]AEB93288.1 asparaginyl-tRNA synthetase [Lactobacillus johnsonii DPC 6026]AHA97355.1 asparaginyl-tRNA synthase [Lactobacillus johnsonii N6.2]AOG25644.1 asparagine--tRNA ligase [Lactobacillus johnsonii]AYN48869.1 Asparagine--tRNA ligase [L
MTELISIKDSSKHVDQEVKMHVWLTDKRSSGKIIFLQLRDGTAFFQGVIRKNDVSEEVFEAAKSLRQEASFYITGTVHEDKRSHFGYEIQISDLEIVSNNEGYPIGNKEHGVDFLLDNRHLWLRSKRPFAIMQIRNTMFKATVDFFEKEGFIKFDAPIFMHSAPEGTTQLFHVEYFNNDAYLSQSGQLYGEAGAMAYGKIFTFGPTFRAEESKGRRHMTEFWMMEPEMAWMHQDESLDIQERYLAYMVKQVLENNEYELKILGRDPEKLRPTTEGNFTRLSYDDAIKMLQEAGRDIKWGDDFGAPDEGYISEQFDRPVFIVNYPTTIKPFYMKKNPDNPKEYLCADVIAPEGYGEIFGGSEREGNYEILKQQIEEAGLNLEDYQWYLDLRKFGGVPHSGFGMGFERTIAWICKLDHIREAIPFPRLINRMQP